MSRISGTVSSRHARDLNPHIRLLLGTPQPRAQTPLPNSLPGCGGRKVRNIWENAVQIRYCSHCREFNPCSIGPFLAKERPHLVQLQQLYTQQPQLVAPQPGHRPPDWTGRIT